MIIGRVIYTIPKESIKLIVFILTLVITKEEKNMRTIENIKELKSNLAKDLE